jgi:hypothetical protein
MEMGYHIYGSDEIDTSYEGANSKYSVWTRKDNESSFLVPTEETFLDRKFWQALGRALGWSEGCELAISCRHGEEEGQRYRGYYWTYQWYGFIQALADGNPPDAFFAPLPSARMRSSGTTHRHQVEQARPHRSRLVRLAQETRQLSRHLFEAAAGAQARAQDMVRRSRHARHRQRGV